MITLALHNLTRRFASGGGVSNISLEVARGEFVVLLGPSGCGKSTLLRLIAGLEQPDGGEIVIDGVVQSKSGRRDSIAMVFQNFALYPHMSLFDNIAFPLRLRKVSHDEIVRRVRETAAKAGLELNLDRYPREISGGERQRVALARALVREPAIVLMDEPLASLDAQLRSSLRVELKQFQQRSGRTFVYVTHDQVEALSLADRIAVMKSGVIEQLGTPQEIFERPRTEFVARFVGDPPINLFEAEVAADGQSILAGCLKLDVTPPKPSSGAILVGIRPGDLTVDPLEDSTKMDATVESIEFSGTSWLVHARAGNLAIQVLSSSRMAAGERRSFYVPKRKLHFFDAITKERLENMND
jgi:multiple sugar transport system ATP-binding protein